MNKNKGFTLIEVIVTLAILVIIITAIYSFFINNYKTAQTEIKRANIDQQAKTLIDNIKQWLQMADQNTIKYDDNPSFNQRTVEMEVYDPSHGNVSTKTMKIQFFTNTKKLYIYNGMLSSTATLYLDGYIDDMQVEYQNNSYIKIKFVVDYKMNNIKRTYEIFYNIRSD